ncbi:MAG: branched-chain amino acid ABC transporter substrate-binding protein [bacterium]
MNWRRGNFREGPQFRLMRLLALLTLVVACREPTPYHIGIVLNPDGARGAAVAIETINAHGGIHGHRLELVDLGGGASTRAKLALETADSLASDSRVLAVVGHTNSSASIAASQVYNARHVVQIAPTSTSPLYGQAGPYSFRLVASDDFQGVFLADQALNRAQRPRVAVVYVNDDYGRPLRRVVAARLQSAGLAPVFDAPYAEDDAYSNQGELVMALAQTRPDLLLWIGRATDYGDIVPSLKRALPRLEIIASDGFGSSELTTDSLHRFDGVRYVRLVDLARNDSSLRQLQARYVRDGFGELSDQAVLSYDAVTLLAEAIRNAGPKREAIRAWLADMVTSERSVMGLSGPIVFASSSSRAPQYFLERVHAGARKP